MRRVRSSICEEMNDSNLDLVECVDVDVGRGGLGCDCDCGCPGVVVVAIVVDVVVVVVVRMGVPISRLLILVVGLDGSDNERWSRGSVSNGQSDLSSPGQSSETTREVKSVMLEKG